MTAAPSVLSMCSFKTGSKYRNTIASLWKNKMVRNYKTKGERGRWTVENMKLAAAAVRDRGLSLKAASRDYCVPRTTLRRHLQKGGTIKKQLGRRTVLTEEHENELQTLILDMEKRLYGLTLRDVRRLVFQFCELRAIKHPFNKNKRLAGKDWADAFLKRHPTISLRVPEPTSLARAIGFNRTKVTNFYEMFQTVVFKDGRKVIPDTNIYNVDESGYSTVHAPSKILAQKGKRTVGTLTSAEKGKTITVVCCMSATGQFVPPLFVFPRVRMREELMERAVPGAIGRANPSGWINEDIFTDWFHHFLAHVQPKFRPEPTLLILDGHSSHTKNLAIIELARQNNVLILSLPSHCTHKLQPLDRTFFKSLNSSYNTEVQLWLRNHPGRALTEHLVPELIRTAYSKSATLDIATNGFRKCGLVPYNPEIFSDDDFRGAEMSGFDPNNFPEEIVQLPVNGKRAGHDSESSQSHDNDNAVSPVIQCPQANNELDKSKSAKSDGINPEGRDPTSSFCHSSSLMNSSSSVSHLPLTSIVQSSTSGLQSFNSSQQPAFDIHPSTSSTSTTKSSSTTALSSGTDSQESSPSSPENVSFSEILGNDIVLPSQDKSKRKRKVAYAEVLTSSPYKRNLEASKLKQPALKVSVNREETAPTQKINKGKRLARKGGKKAVRQPPNTKEWYCLVCKEPWSRSQAGENWIQCGICSDWAHELCTSFEGLSSAFICDYCDD